jgi:hypothetical protein
MKNVWCRHRSPRVPFPAGSPGPGAGLIGAGGIIPSAQIVLSQPETSASSSRQTDATGLDAVVREIRHPDQPDALTATWAAAAGDERLAALARFQLGTVLKLATRSASRRRRRSCVGSSPRSVSQWRMSTTRVTVENWRGGRRHWSRIYCIDTRVDHRFSAPLVSVRIA